MLEGSFLAGKLEGDNIAYYPDGVVKHRFTFRDGKKIGTNYEYHPSSKIKTKEVSTNNGIDLSQWNYDTNGVLTSEKKFRNDQPHGQWVYYYDNSETVRLRETYLNGKLTDKRISYYRNGKIEKEETYAFGLLAGPFKYYYEDGTLQSAGTFKSNRKFGLFTSYYPNGKIREQGEYVGDKQHKEWKEYDEQGNLKRTIIFRAGTVVEIRDEKK